VGAVPTNNANEAVFNPDARDGCLNEIEISAQKGSDKRFAIINHVNSPAQPI